MIELEEEDRGLQSHSRMTQKHMPDIVGQRVDPVLGKIQKTRKDHQGLKARLMKDVILWWGSDGWYRP